MVSARATRVWLQIHTWTSLISMVFLLMLCLTGLPLIFHHEIDELLEHPIAAPPMRTETDSPTASRICEATVRIQISS